MKAPVLARVIIVNYNGRRWLDDCLDALLPQCAGVAEIVLVDNGSHDGSVDHVRERFPSIEIRELARNEGFAAANNRGASGATAPYLVFLNNDTRVRSGWLSALLASAGGSPSADMVSSHVVFQHDPRIVDSAGDGYLRAGGAFKRFHGTPTPPPARPHDVFGVCAAACLVRRTLFEQLAGFDEDFFLVYEDVDLSYRARLIGATVLYAPAAIVEHVGGASLDRASDLAVFHGQRNLEWTWIKNTPRALLWRSAIPHAGYVAASFVAFAVRGRATIWLRAKLAAYRELPAVLRKRRDVQRMATAAPSTLWNAMDGGWLTVKRREKRFAWRQAPQ